MLFLNIVLLIIGLVLLIKGADVFVDGASNIARKLKIPSLIIGLTLVSIGTSAPELSISVTSALQGMNNMSFGNVIGSNTFNVLVVIGISALFTRLAVSGGVKKIDSPILIGIYAVLILFGFVITPLVFDRIEAALFLVIFVLYVILLIFRGKKEQTDEEESGEPIKKWYVSLILVAAGIAAIIFGGDLVVDAASKIAITFGMSELMVGLTIVAVGTSLPELVTSVVAAKKGENELALGNVVGSNIFNILFILGIAGTVNPLTTGNQFIVDVLVMLAVTVLLFIFSLSGKLKKWHGIIFISCYALYLAYLIIRTLIA